MSSQIMLQVSRTAKFSNVNILKRVNFDNTMIKKKNWLFRTHRQKEKLIAKEVKAEGRQIAFKISSNPLQKDKRSNMEKNKMEK